MLIEFTLFFNSHFHDSCDYRYYNNVCLKNKIVAFGQQYPRDAHLPADKQASLHSMTVGSSRQGAANWRHNAHTFTPLPFSTSKYTELIAHLVVNHHCF